MEGLGGTSPGFDELRRRLTRHFSRRVLSGRIGSQHASGGAGRPRRLTNKLTDCGASNLHRPNPTGIRVASVSLTEGTAFQAADQKHFVRELLVLATKVSGAASEDTEALELGRAKRTRLLAG
jgi:hypothetical protein